MPHSPSGGGSMAPPMSPCPPLSTSMKDLRSRVSAIARRRSGVERGCVSIDDQRAADISRPQLANRLRRLDLDVLQQWDGHLVGKSHVELSRDESQQRS